MSDINIWCVDRIEHNEDDHCSQMMLIAFNLIVSYFEKYCN